jgi:lipoprotein LpqH
VKRKLWMAVGGACALTAAAAGCANDNHASAPSPKAPATSTGIASAATSSAAIATPAAAGETRVIIGGQPQNVGKVMCSMTNGKFSIAIGDPITGVIVGLEKDGSAVHDAGLGMVDGVVLSFTEGVPGNQATATKTGDHYTITGTAIGTDNTGQQVTSKPFEIDATCPQASAG